MEDAGCAGKAPHQAGQVPHVGGDQLNPLWQRLASSGADGKVGVVQEHHGVALRCKGGAQPAGSAGGGAGGAAGRWVHKRSRGAPRPPPPYASAH